MTKILDFNKVYQINLFLKKRQIGYSLHCIGACGGEIVELKHNTGDERTAEAVCEIINEFLQPYFMQIEPVSEGSYDLRVK